MMTKRAWWSTAGGSPIIALLALLWLVASGCEVSDLAKFKKEMEHYRKEKARYYRESVQANEEAEEMTQSVEEEARRTTRVSNPDGTPIRTGPGLTTQRTSIDSSSVRILESPSAVRVPESPTSSPRMPEAPTVPSPRTFDDPTRRSTFR